MRNATVMSGSAWQPFTPRGVAAFAFAPWGRLLLAQLVVAALCAAIAAWFVRINWVPVVRAAVEGLPAGAGVRGGILRWTTNTPVRLAENRFLALVVDAQGTATAGRVADLEVTLHDRHLTAASLLGSVQIPYPLGGWKLSLDSTEAIPWWGAWEGPSLAILFGAVTLGLMGAWFLLATLYCPAVWIFGVFINRWLGLRASWKLSGAALMPGAVVVVLGLIGYGMLGLDLIRLGLFFLLHIVTGWVYLLASPLFLPGLPEAEALSRNPFALSDEEKPSAPARQEENPFAPPRQ
jgi:hypothetical protein